MVERQRLAFEPRTVQCHVPKPIALPERGYVTGVTCHSAKWPNWGNLDPETGLGRVSVRKSGTVSPTVVRGAIPARSIFSRSLHHGPSLIRFSRFT